ncbi:MAG: DUF368 domain-containing protein [Streptococcaceae bacterium]|nr:DUF368 domain-containing protein [Streptococcaceae bacterium]
MIIALGFILPGISGGVLAAILGIYERMLSFMAHLTRNFKENILFFLPVGIGGILGIGLLSRPLEFLLEHYQVIVLWGFAGAIIGTFPSLIKESTKKSQRDRLDIIWFVATAIIGGLFLYFLPQLFGTLPANFASFILAGALIALGVLVPGLSPSNLLLILGLYSPMLNGFKSFDITGVFLPIAIGGMAAMLIFSKTMEYLLEAQYSRVYHFILGLVIASTVLILIPNQSAAESISYTDVTGITIVLSVIFCLLGIFLGSWMSRLEEKYK